MRGSWRQIVITLIGFGTSVMSAIVGSTTVVASRPDAEYDRGLQRGVVRNVFAVALLCLFSLSLAAGQASKSGVEDEVKKQ